MELERDIYIDLLHWKKNNSRQVLLLEGARQVGKTHIIKKFAREQYKHVIYINLSDDSGELFLDCYEKLHEDIRNHKFSINDNSLKELFKRYDDKFVDSSDTIIIIDEIQESYKIYNKIRGFSRELESHVVVTGSYLGRVVNNKEFWSPVGDVYALQVYPLSFEEFLKAFSLFDLYFKLDLYGSSDKEDYEKISKMFSVYSVIGGYPAVVVNLKETGDISECRKIISNIVRIFCEESARYFNDSVIKESKSDFTNNIIDVNIFNHTLESITKLLVNEKKGFKEDSFNEALQKIVRKEYSSNISKDVCHRAISWLESAKIIRYCNKIINCNINDFRVMQRCFFTDLGIVTHLLNLINTSDSDEIGLINESFVFNCLARKLNSTPAFATLNNGELDFLVKSDYDSKLYGIEVRHNQKNNRPVYLSILRHTASASSANRPRYEQNLPSCLTQNIRSIFGLLFSFMCLKAGKNSGKTISEALKLNKIDYALYLKGNTLGGIDKENKIVTIPIYLFERFKFDIAERVLSRVDRVTLEANLIFKSHDK